MGNDRDRALLAFFVSSGAWATELLELIGERVDWGRQRIWVVSKGSREVSMIPGSPEAFVYLARYFDAFGTPEPAERVWRTMRGTPRPSTYWAMRRVMQRANDQLGTNWSLHDLRHTAAARMAADQTPPRPNPLRARRTRQLPSRQPGLDALEIDLYGDHQCLPHYARRRRRSRPRNQRGAVHPSVPRHTDGADH